MTTVSTVAKDSCKMYVVANPHPTTDSQKGFQ